MFPGRSGPCPWNEDLWSLSVQNGGDEKNKNFQVVRWECGKVFTSLYLTNILIFLLSSLWPTRQSLCYYPWFHLYSYLRLLIFPQRVDNQVKFLSYHCLSGIFRVRPICSSSSSFSSFHVFFLCQLVIRVPPCRHSCDMRRGSSAMGLDNRGGWANLLLNNDSAQAHMWCH